jgi:predicted dehydrogenase
MTDRIGIGVIGTGFMGGCHAFAWHSVRALFDDVATPDLVTICDNNAQAAAAARESFGFRRAMSDWHALIADPDIAVVSITLPNAMHAEVAIAALRAGKHVWCEKPMALTLADAEAMAQAASTAPGKTALGYNYLRNPSVSHAVRLITAGAIGRVVHIQGEMHEDYAANPALPWSWRYRRADAGLGVLADLMVHLVSMTSVLAGPIARVTGDLATVHRSRPMPDAPGESGDVDNEDIATALVRFANGATGTLSASRVAWGRKNRLRWEVHGTAGTLVFDQERMNELLLYQADGPAPERGFRTILSGPEHPPYDRLCPEPGHQIGFNELKIIEAAELLRAIAGLGPPPTSFQEGLHIECVIHAIAKSAAGGQWVEVAA